MTWVFGTNTPFGYAIGLSDIRVTVGDDQFDCLQKLYPISRFVVAGFAGSVRIGFEMVDRLQRWLGRISEQEAVVPDDVANKFPPLAQHAFAEFPEEERAGGSHMILFCVDPRPENAGQARSEIYIFRDPDFAAERIYDVRMVSVGSGAAAYEDALLDFNSDPFGYLQFAVAGPD